MFVIYFFLPPPIFLLHSPSRFGAAFFRWHFPSPSSVSSYSLPFQICNFSLLFPLPPSMYSSSYPSSFFSSRFGDFFFKLFSSFSVFFVLFCASFSLLFPFLSSSRYSSSSSFIFHVFYFFSFLFSFYFIFWMKILNLDGNAKIWQICIVLRCYKENWKYRKSPAEWP